MASYTRQSSFSDGDTITAALFNNEYNQLLTAFSYASSGTTGHKHDGTAGEGAHIPQIGDQDFNNKIAVDSSNNRFGVFVEVSSSAVEQVRFQDGAIVPVTDNDIDLGTSSVEFKDGYFDGTLHADAINFNGTAITATAAELNIMDGVTSTAAELNILDGVTASTAELNYSDTGSSTGTVVADKVVTVDSNKDVSSFRNITLTGELDAGSLDISGDADIDGTLETDALSINGTAVTSTAAELNILDGVTATAAELNYSDTGQSVGTVVAGKVVTVDSNKDVASFRNITLTGELDAGSLDISGDADIDGTLETDALSINGTTVTSTAAELNILDGVTSTAAELNILDGVTATASEINTLDGITAVVGELNALDLGSTAVGTAIASKAVILDANKDYTGIRNLTITGELDAATLDISGDVDVDGTLETDALSINGTAVTSTAAELNILDGVTVTAAEINTLDGITAVLSELNALDLGSTAVGTAVASKAVILDSNKDYTGIRNFTITGELDAATLDISGDIDVDGTTNLDVVDIDGAVDFASTTAHAGNASFADNAKAIFGAGSDLQIYHDGSHSYIQEAGTGNLRILAENFTVRNPSNNESMIIAAPDGAVTLFHDSSARLATTSTGVSVTGAITGTSATFTTADNESQLTLKSTDADADVGPVLDLTRDSGSPADGDAIGRIRYRFDNDNGDEETAIFLDGTLTDASDGTEDASFKIQTKVAGTARNRIDITSSEVVFNEDSVDLDFRVESNGSTKKFFVDGGENVVCINTDSPRGIASTSNRQFQMEGTSGISSSFSIARNQNSTGGPGLFFGKTRGTEFGAVTIVQDGDSLGSIGFAAADGTDVAHQAASIAAEVDGTPGANDVPGRIVFKTTPDGSTTLNERMRINAQGDLLFNTTVDYGGTINIARGTNDEVAYFVSTDADSSTGPVVTLLRASASPADNDVAGRLSFSAYNSAGADTRFGKIQLVLTDVTDGTEDGRLEFEVMEDGAERSGMTLGASGAVFNEDSRGEFDFRVESNANTHMLFVDSGTNTVRIGSVTQISSSDTTLQVTADSGERAADVYRPTSTGTGVIFAAFSDVGGTATKVFEVEANGDVENATNSYSTISDQRLKQDIVDANSQWNDIKSLQIRNFRFINDVNQNGEDALRHIGVVAQEVESAGMTGLVKTRNDEDTGEEIKSVKSSIIYMKAVKALQEAITRIETLEAEVTALKGGS